MKKLIAASIALVSVAANAQLMPISSSLMARAEAPAAIANFVGVAAPVHAALGAALVAPHRLNTIEAANLAIANDVKVTFTVDKDGVPQNIQISKSYGATTDAEIVKAVSALRYAPGTLHGQKVDFPVALMLKAR